MNIIGILVNRKNKLKDYERFLDYSLYYIFLRSVSYINSSWVELFHQSIKEQDYIE